MNDLTAWSGSLEWDDLPEEIRWSLDAINRAKDDMVQSGIRIGKELCAIKARCQHGQLAQLAEKHTGLKERQCRNFMRIYREFGQNGNTLPFSDRALIALTTAPDPQAALSEAEARQAEGESITAKQAKEIAALHKQIELAKQQLAAAEPTMDDLIPELRRLHTSGDIPQRTALEFSKLHQDVQRGVVLPKFHEKVDPRKASRALHAWLSSWAPAHEAKEATVAYALWLWTHETALDDDQEVKK